LPPKTGRSNAAIRYQFPLTSWDLLAEASGHGGQSTIALNEFAERYYTAVRAFIAAITRDHRDPEDLTQRFFEMVVLSGHLLRRADPQKGRFRPYLKQAIRNFLVDEHRRDTRSVDPDVRPDALEAGWDTIATESSPGPDAELLRAWARSLVAIAMERLETVCEEKGQRQHFTLFVHRYVQDPDRRPPWREVGNAFALDEKTARSRAETAARRFRVILRNLIASDMGSDGDIDKELQAVIALL
jgi:RNA polymerase sigma-70 factor (ECF subfamily)